MTAGWMMSSNVRLRLSTRCGFAWKSVFSPKPITTKQVFWPLAFGIAVSPLTVHSLGKSAQCTYR